jgi:hypothetical protein
MKIVRCRSWLTAACFKKQSSPSKRKNSPHFYSRYRKLYAWQRSVYSIPKLVVAIRRTGRNDMHEILRDSAFSRRQSAKPGSKISSI